MKKILNFFSYERKPCQIMTGLVTKSIPVNYPSAIVNGMVREAQVKVWEVAAKTTEPEETSTSHAKWMTEVQVARAEAAVRIAELEHAEIMHDVKHYMNGIGEWSPKVLPNS